MVATYIDINNSLGRALSSDELQTLFTILNNSSSKNSIKKTGVAVYETDAKGNNILDKDGNSRILIKGSDNIDFGNGSSVLKIGLTDTSAKDAVTKIVTDYLASLKK
jgi:hypothetical protein